MCMAQAKNHGICYYIHDVIDNQGKVVYIGSHKTFVRKNSELTCSTMILWCCSLLSTAKELSSCNFANMSLLR